MKKKTETIHFRLGSYPWRILTELSAATGLSLSDVARAAVYELCMRSIDSAGFLRPDVVENLGEVFHSPAGAQKLERRGRKLSQRRAEWCSDSLLPFEEDGGVADDGVSREVVLDEPKYYTTPPPELIKLVRGIAAAESGSTVSGTLVHEESADVEEPLPSAPVSLIEEVSISLASEKESLRRRIDLFYRNMRKVLPPPLNEDAYQEMWVSIGSAEGADLISLLALSDEDFVRNCLTLYHVMDKRLANKQRKRKENHAGDKIEYLSSRENANNYQ
jgi:hypothetical protein